MRVSKSPKSAISRLRGFALPLGAMLLSAGMALFAFSVANSSADGANSQVDYYLELNIGSTNNQYASHPETGLLGGQTTVTWEAWIYPVDGTLNREAIFSKEGNFALGLQAGQLFAAFSDSNGSNEITTTTGVRPPINAWSHVAFVKNGTSVLIYLNGFEVINRANGAYSTVRSAARELRIGNRENGERFKGRIDEVRIWETVARTEAQIQWGMHKKINPLTDLNASERSALIGYWDFNEPDSSTTAFARHTNFVRNLTLVNGPNRADVKQVSSAAGGDTVITFPRTYLSGVGGWTVPGNVANFHAVIVGGGGGGGTRHAGGGGGGGFLTFNGAPASQPQEIVVGPGGRGARELAHGDSNPNFQPKSGQNSSAFGLTAFGGGSGGSSYQSPASGGSGGGSANAAAGASGTLGQGNAGGTGRGNPWSGGGGGGAGGAGLAATQDNVGAAGGAGISTTISGVVQTLAAGGGGSGTNGGGAGGSGVGGAGGFGTTSPNREGKPGQTFGSGGGGGSFGTVNFAGGDGATGVVIVRYTTTIDTALALTADSDHLASSSGLIPSVYTFEAWIRPTSFANSPMIYSQGGANGDSALWLSWQGNPQVEWGSTSYADISSYTFPLNQWTHVAVSKDGSGVPRLFINSRNIWTGTANTGTFAGQFKIGQWWAHSGNDFIGDIDQVKIWSSTLGEASLLSSMHSYSTSTVTQGAGHTLHAHYDMNDGEQEIELDRSGNGRHLSRVSLSSAFFSSSNIVVTGTAHTEQNFVRFNRSYLTANGGWTPPAGVSRFKALIVAGGGGGSRGSCSNWWGAGGGGGGVISSASFALPSNPTAVIVGQGGARSSAGCETTAGSTAIGQPGQPSSFGAHSADGGQPASNASRNGATSGNGLAGAVGSGLSAGGGGGAGSSGGSGGDIRNGGASITSNIAGPILKVGAGGPGRGNDGWGTYDGNVPHSNQLSHWDPNSGGGGADWTGGASGVVIVSWGSYLEVSRSPAVARAGSTFTQSIQVRQANLGGALNTAPFQISVTASAWLTINGNPLTQSYTVTSNNGVADFTGLGFAANVPGPVTLNFFSNSFVGTSLVVTPTYFAAGVNILASGTTTGHFFEGAFFASQSNTIATINRNDLLAHLASFSTVISSSDRIWVQATVSSTATHSLTLRSANDVSLFSGISIQTNNGDIVFWSDSDGNGAGLIEINQSAQINSANGRTGNGQSGGGRITLAGSFGNSGVDSAGHPLGAAASSTTHALRLRENSRLFSGGGNITIRVNGNVNSTSLGGEAFYQFGGSEVNSGTGQILVSAISRNTANGFLTAGGSWISSATLSPAIEFLAQTAATNNEAFEQFNNTLLSVVSLGSASVGISMSAMVNASAPTMHATWLPSRIDLLSAQGDIQFTSNGHLRLTGLDARHIASKPNSLVTSSSADVLIRAQALVEDNANISSAISTSGAVSIQPLGVTFNASSSLRFAVEASDLLVGSRSAIANYSNPFSIDRPVTVSGTVRVYADALTVNAGATITSTSTSGLIEIGSDGSTTLNSTLRTSGNVNLLGSGMAFSSAVITGSPAVVIESFANQFGSAVSTANLTFGSTIKSLRVGRTTNTSDITLGSSATVSGPVYVYGGTITHNTAVDIVVSSASAAVLYKATGAVIFPDGSSETSRPMVRTNNGDIIVWSDSDGDGTGRIFVGIYAVLDSSGGRTGNGLSGGGRITLAGSYGNAGTDSEGHPLGAAAVGAVFEHAFALNWYSKIFSGGGDITMRANSGGSAQVFVHNPDAQVNSGTGKIYVEAISRDSRIAYLNQGGTFLSAATSSPAIEVRAQTNGSNVAAFSQTYDWDLSFVSTGQVDTGISISAVSGAAAGNGIHIAQDMDFLSAFGDINIYTNGYFNVGSAKVRNIGAKAGSLVASSSADITIRSSAFVDTTGNNTSKISTSGNVSLLPNSAGYLALADFRFNVESGDFTFGNAASVDSATNYIFIASNITASGAVTIAANTVYIHNSQDVVSIGQGSPVTLKARELVEVRSGTSTDLTRIESNGGPITFWSDADGNGTGPVSLQQYVTVNSANGDYSKTRLSGGGDITIAGGLDANADQRPDGFAANTSGYDRAVLLDWYVKLYSGGGDISIKGKSTSTYGVLLYSHNEIFSGAGKIDIYGEGGSYGATFIDANWSSGQTGPLTIVSHTSQSPAISIHGQTAGTGTGLRLLGGGGGNIITIASTAETGGGVNLYGQAGSSAAHDFDLLNASVLSRKGAITVSANAKYMNIDRVSDSIPNRFGSVAESAYVTTSSANVTILGDSIDFNGGLHTFGTSGDVTVQPKNGNTFALNHTFAFSTDGIRNLTIGKNPIVGDTDRTITITGTHSVSGEIKIYGGDVIVDGTSTFLRATSTISVVATANIVSRENITTFGGDIWFQSRALGAAEGGITIDAASTLSTNGGSLVFSGGVNPLTDFAVGTEERTDRIGVNLSGQTVSINTAGGDVIMRGSQGADVDSNLGGGLYLSPGTSIQSQGGDISLHGRLTSQTTNENIWHAGVLLGNSSTGNPVLIDSGAGDIFIEGDGSANPRDFSLGILNARSSITSSTGDIRFEGHSSYANHWTWGRSTASSTVGSVEIHGRGTGGSYPDGLTMSSSNRILIQDDKIFFNWATIFTGSAQVTLQSSASSFVTLPVLTKTSFDNGLSGLTLGRTSETGTWALNRAMTINGPITVYGGTINIQAAHTITSASARATFKSRGDIITNAAGDVTTNGGAIVFWSDSDGNSANGGRIAVVEGSELRTSGGDIVLGAGLTADSDDYPTGFAKGSIQGISLAGLLSSGAGDIVIRGASPTNAPGATPATPGVFLTGSAIVQATSGNISISGAISSDTLDTAVQYGVWIGISTPTGPVLQSTTGRIDIFGDASQNLVGATSNRQAVRLASGVISTSGDVTIRGQSRALNPGLDITGTGVLFQISTSANVTLEGGTGGAINLGRVSVVNANQLSILTDDLRASTDASSLRANAIVIDEAPASNGLAQLRIPQGVTIQNSSGELRIGSDSVRSVLVSNQVSLSGNVRVTGQNVSLSANVFAGGASPAITISADVFDATGQVRALGGNVAFQANTPGRGILLGGATTSPLLSLTDSELDAVSTANLRIGDSSTANIFVSGNISISSAQVNNLILRAAGNVVATGGANISAANLAVQAGGTIDLSGQNSVGGSVALVGPGGTSYSSAVSYSPAIVDGVVPVFGVGAAVSLTNSPSVQQSNRFLAVTFNPPPQILVTDAYQNVLDGNNRLAYQYTASASVASGSGTVTGLTTSSRVGGNISFTAIRVINNPGVYAFTLSAQIDPTTTLSVRTGDFNVMGGEPGFLRVNARTTSAAVGQTGLNFLVTVEDDYGNPVTAGDFANISVSAIVTGATIVSGGEVRAGDDGVATFSNLILNGSASSEVSISFKVTFNRLSDQQLTTVTSEETRVFLTHGTATKMVISSDNQSRANRSTLSQVVISLQDAFGNQVFNQSGQVTVSIGSGSGATLVGSTAVTLTAGSSEPAVATFSNLALQGTVGDYRLDFEYSVAGVTSISHTVTLTPGAATALVLDVAAAGARAGIALTQQPRLTLQDVDGNIVPANASVSATVDNATLAGTTQLELVDGFATYSGLVLTGTAQMQSMTYEVTAPAGFTSFSTSQSLNLAPGVPYKLDFNATANDSKAGVIQSSARPIRLLDEWDNPTSQSSAVSVLVQVVSSSDTTQVNKTVGTYTIASGAISTNITLADTAVTLSGTYQFKLSATGLQDGFSNTFTITNAEADKLVVIENVGATVRSGVSISPAVRLQVQDAFGNPVLDSTTSVSVSAVAGNVLQILGGVAENTLGSSFIDLPDLAVVAKIGSARLEFHASHLSAAIDGTSIQSAQFTVAFGLAHQLTVSPVAVTVANRENLGSITVEVLDSAENLVADAAVNVTAAVTGATLTGTPGAITSGGSFTYTDLAISGTAGDYELDFTATGLVKATVEVTLGHGAAHNLVMQLDPQAKNAITMSAITVSIFDRDGNLVTTGPQSTQNVTLAGFGADLLGDDVVPAVGGIATFSNVALKGVIGDKTISASISLPTTITQEVSVELGFGNPDRLDLTTTATGFVNRVPFFRAPVITVRDISNNVVPANGMDIRITVETASISGSITTSAATGIATFASDLVLRGLVGSHDLVFTAEGTSSSGVVSASQTIALTHGSASQIVLTQTSSQVLAGINFGFQPILELRDPEGNLVNTTAEASSGVAVSYTGPAWDADAKTGVDFTGTKNISFVNGVATYQDLRFSGQIGNYTLDYVSALNSNIATSEVVQLEHGTADRIAVIQGPEDVVAGATFTNTVQVELLDQFHNRAIRLTESATLVARLLNASNQNTIATSAEFGAQAGVVSFTGLNFTSAGSRYIQFEEGANSSTSNLIAVTTNVFTITHAAPSQIEWVYQPAASVMNDVAVAGASSTSPVLIAKDQFNNVVDTGTVQISVHVTSGTVQQISGTQVSGVSGSAVVPALTLRALVGNYTLEFRASTAADPTVFDSISHVIEVTPGAANSIVATTHPTLARSSLAFVPQPVLEIRDTAGNRVSQSSDVVAVSVQGATLTGQTSMAASAGVASFTNVKLAGSASNAVTLSYTIQGTNISTTSAIPLVAGVATEMKLEWTVTNIKTRGEITQSPKLILLDEDGNKVITDQTTTASASLMRQGVVVTTSPTISTAVNGEILLDGLVFIARPDVAYHLRFDSDGLPSVSTSEFVVLPGPVEFVEIFVQPGSQLAGVTTRTGEKLLRQPEIYLRDFDGNLVTTENGTTVSASIFSGAGGTVLSASASVVDGIARFTDLGLEGLVETPTQSAELYKLEFSFGAITSSPSADLSVMHNVAHRISILTPASGGRSGLDFETKPQVVVLDRYGNRVFKDNALNLTANPIVTSGTGTAAFSNNNTGARNNQGVYTFNMGISGLVGNTYALNFVHNQGVVIAAQQTGITITHGLASKIGFLTLPNTLGPNQETTATGANLRIQPVIEIQDAVGNRVLDFTEDVVATIETAHRGNRDYLSGNSVSAVAGVATFQNLKMVVDPAQQYRLNFTFRQSSFVANIPLQVTHAAPEYLTISTSPLAGNKTGDALQRSPVLTVHDFDGNLTTAITGASVSAHITTGNGYVVQDGNHKALVQGGVAEFQQLKIVAPPGEAQRLTFRLDGFANSASATVSSQASANLSFTFGDAHKLVVNREPCTGSNCSIGRSGEVMDTQPIVEVQDFYGNRVTNHSGQVIVEAQGQGGFLRNDSDRIDSAVAQFASGLATFATLRLEGTPGVDYTLRFSSGNLLPTTSAVIQVRNNVAHSLVVTTQPVGGVTGELLATPPIVEMRDRFGNLVVDHVGADLQVTAIGPSRIGGFAPAVSSPGDGVFVGGVASFTNLRLTGLVNTDYVLQFSDGNRSVTSNALQLSAAGAARIELLNVPAADRTGDLLTVQPSLRVLDFDGNLAVSTSVTVTASVTGGGYIESGTTSSAVDGGYITFSSLVLVAPVGVPQQLTFTATTASGSFAVSTTTALVVRHTDTAYFEVLAPVVQGNFQQGAVLATQPKLQAFDRYGNPAISDNSTVLTASIGAGSGGAISGSATAQASGGVVQFAGLAVTGSPGVQYTLRFSANLGGAYFVDNTSTLTLFKTAALTLNYANTVYSASATVSPTVAFTDSTEHSPVYTTTTGTRCSVDPATAEVTILGAGDCTIVMTIDGGTFYRANQISTTFTIAKADQTPVVITNANNVPFGQVLNLTAVGGSSTAQTRFFVDGTCRTMGNVLVPLSGATEGSPSCFLIAQRAGDANFKPFTTDEMPITVTRIPQQPLQIGNSLDTKVGNVELFTIGGSGNGEITYTVTFESSANLCTISGSTLSTNGSGNCEVMASKAQDQNHTLASSPAVVFTFSKQIQQLTFTSLPPSMPLPGQLYQASVTASSGLTVSYSITIGGGSPATSQSPAVPAVCALTQGNLGEIQFLRSGNCQLTATQSGNEAFGAATVAMLIQVGSLNQFITFPPMTDTVFGTPAFRLTAVASSDLPVSYTTSAGITACSVNQGLVTLLSAGLCEIVASQAGDSTFAAAPNVSRVFRVLPDRASAPSLVSAAVGNQWFTLRYTQPSYNGGSPIIGYRLEVLDQGTNSAGVYVNSACSTTAPLTCTMVGLPNNRPYVARVAAITAAGVGLFSQYTSAMTPTNAEASVTQLFADVSANGLDLNWVAPLAFEGTFQRYEVFVWETGTQEPQTASATVASSNSTAITIPQSSISNTASISQISNQGLTVIRPAMNLTNRLFVFGSNPTRPAGFISLASVQNQSTISATAEYSIKVVTITDTYTESMPVNTANGLKLGLSTPAAPTQLGLDTSDPSKITVAWAPPLSDGGFAILNYSVVVNGQTICANIPTRTCVISPLRDSTTYNIQVMARNALGLGASAVASHTTPTPPPPPVVETSGGGSGGFLPPISDASGARVPQFNSFTPSVVRPGQVVVVDGNKLDTITRVMLGGVDVNFVLISNNELHFVVPTTTKPGLYSVERFTDFGRYINRNAITVMGDPVSESIVVPNPVTQSPTTSVPVTPGPSTQSPVTPGPSTQSPVTPGPATQSPVTPGPSTQSPVTPGPVTPGPATQSPVIPGEEGEGPGTQEPGSDQNGSGSDGEAGRGSSTSSPGGSGGSNGSGETDGSEQVPPGEEGETDSENVAIGENESEPVNPLIWIFLVAMLLAAGSYFALRRKGD